jgi:hypothetical protein
MIMLSLNHQNHLVALARCHFSYMLKASPKSLLASLSHATMTPARWWHSLALWYIDHLPHKAKIHHVFHVVFLKPYHNDPTMMIVPLQLVLCIHVVPTWEFHCLCVPKLWHLKGGGVLG